MVLIKYSGKYVKIYFNMKITFLLLIWGFTKYTLMYIFVIVSKLR